MDKPISGGHKSVCTSRPFHSRAFSRELPQGIRLKKQHEGLKSRDNDGIRTWVTFRVIDQIRHELQKTVRSSRRLN